MATASVLATMTSSERTGWILKARAKDADGDRSDFKADRTKPLEGKQTTDKTWASWLHRRLHTGLQTCAQIDPKLDLANFFRGTLANSLLFNCLKLHCTTANFNQTWHNVTLNIFLVLIFKKCLYVRLWCLCHIPTWNSLRWGLTWCNNRPNSDTIAQFLLLLNSDLVFDFRLPI